MYEPINNIRKSVSTRCWKRLALAVEQVLNYNMSIRDACSAYRVDPRTLGSLESLYLSDGYNDYSESLDYDTCGY